MTKIYKSYKHFKKECAEKCLWVSRSDTWNACAASKDAEYKERLDKMRELITEKCISLCDEALSKKDAEIERFKKAYIKIKSAYSFKCQCDFLTETTGTCGECEIIAMIEKELNQGGKDE